MEKRLYEAVRYTFDSTEIRELGELLARESQAVINLRAQKTTTTATIGAAIKAAEKRIADLTNRITSGFELRDVECMALLDVPRPGMKRIIRLDTNEAVHETAMSLEEMQSVLDFPAERGE